SMPNKQLACEYVDELTPAAKLVGAINTIVNDDGYLRGYNTDGLRQELLLKNSDLLMLGQYKQENARLRELLGSPLRQDEQKMVT
ncbi:hypothetical protein ONK27_27370, partial [Salmonella enterica subsp. enterica serovar Virginia]|nr:hypothetical protein [Salmonella enterica subsp. enterica serovar Virginia]